MTQVQMAIGEIFLEEPPAKEDREDGLFRILSVGRFVEKKGHLTGLVAFRRFITRKPNAEYTIIGDGPLRRAMEAYIKREGIGPKVHLTGELTQKDVRKEMLRTDVFLFPSETASNGDMEGQGLVVQEAQACGLPVIVTRHNGVPAGMLDGKTGFVVEERDATAMAERLICLEMNSSMRTRMAKTSRQFAVQNFSGTTLAEKLETVLISAFTRNLQVN